jgi:translocation and assembly module TamA
LILQLSQKSNQIGGTYSIDGINPVTDKWMFFANLFTQTLNNKKTNRKELGGGYKSKFDCINLGYEIGTKYLDEKSDVVNDSIPEVTGHYFLPYLSLNWKNSELIDEWMYGTAIEYKIQTTIGKLFSKNLFYQNKISIKHINKGISPSNRIIIRADLGANNRKFVDNLPFSLRFFAGGMNSIRGYGFNNVGPFVTNDEGDTVVIGGSKLFTGSVELEQMISKPFSAAIFTDFGNVTNDWHINPVYSLGIGARYNTKYGAFKLDVAYPLNKIAPNNFKQLPRFALSFGFEF